MEFLIVWAVVASTASLILHLLPHNRVVTDVDHHSLADLLYWMKLQEAINGRQITINDAVLKKLDLV